MSRGTIIGIAFFLLVGVMVFSSLRGMRETTCEVCMTFNGQTLCRTGTGPNEEDAVRAATNAACAVLASGRDENIRCGGTPPTSVSCD